VSVGIGAGVNILHYIYATCAPFAYIKLGVLIGIVLTIAFSLVPILLGVYIVAIFPLLMILIWLVYYCMMRSYFELSAAVLQVSTRLICRYPSTILLVLLQVVLQIVITVAIAVAIGMAADLDMNGFVIVYFIFTFLWISLALGYVVYLTLAGLAGSWYFLTDTEYAPSSPVWESFKRAATTSFGSAALAAFILAVIQLLKVVARSRRRRDEGWSSAILRCLALCIVTCLESCGCWITRYALIYCAVFGVPFREGCRRWAELSVKKFVDVIVGGCVINDAVGINLILFTVGGALVCFGIGYGSYSDSDTALASAMSLAFGGAMASLGIFMILEQPIIATSDTILVCFAEAPDRLVSSASELYQLLCAFYAQRIGELAE
jgi:hypothetical protein